MSQDTSARPEHRPDTTLPATAFNVTAHLDLRRTYQFFKSLLANNNIVLEEMTTLERMLYEGRSFSLEEVLSLTRILVDRSCALVEDLNAMCAGRFDLLFEKAESISRSALDILSRKRAFDSPILLMPLRDISLKNQDEVGGKAANLGEIHNKVGLPTPSGFAVTASAAALFLRETGLLDSFVQQLATIDISDIAGLERVCAKASANVMTAALPPRLEAALREKALEICTVSGPDVRLSVRSSAVCEDSGASFAGQHATVLGATPASLPRAWAAVVASAFTARAVFYRRSKGYSEQDVMMSVLVQPMVRAKASGVLYTVNPNSLQDDDLLLASAWGLGVTVVDGSSDADSWRIRRDDLQILSQEIATKTSGFTLLDHGGIVSTSVPEELHKKPSLTPEQISTIATYGLRLEEHYGMPLDMEWSLDENDQIFILQARPLGRIEEPQTAEYREIPGHPPLIRGGQSAAMGVASGPAYVLAEERPLTDVPKGAILVARQTSPAYVAAMGKVAGIVTDVGSATGHMASVAREFGIPTLVGVGQGTRLLRHGVEITLDASNKAVYAGRVQELLSERKPVNLMQGSPVYEALQQAMVHLTPLNLVDPLAPEFSPEGCQSLHDIIRFCHEMAMQEMFGLGQGLSGKDSATRELQTDLPFQILLLDLGGGISQKSSEQITADDLRCAPLKSLLAGMEEAMLEKDAASFASEATSYAIISQKYVNFSGRLGSHFATIDSFCGPIINDNYITFSFKGGAAPYEHRVRRAMVLAGILRRIGFRVEQKGDSLKAEMRKYDEERFQRRLQTLGRLLASVRDLDWRLDNDDAVPTHVQTFFRSTDSR